jgi:hypothetical protein
MFRTDKLIELEMIVDRLDIFTGLLAQFSTSENFLENSMNLPNNLLNLG